MTCYWDSIRDSLTLNDYNILGFNQKPNMEQFINTIKSKNILVQNVLWQGNEFRNQEIVEHFEAIKNYNISEIKNGHLTSVCDSFLLLLCELLEISIEHEYLNNVIYYKNKKHSRKTLYFKSNKGHFEIDNYKKQEEQRQQIQQNRVMQRTPVVRPPVQLQNQPRYLNIRGIGLNFSLFNK